MSLQYIPKDYSISLEDNISSLIVENIDKFNIFTFNQLISSKCSALAVFILSNDYSSNVYPIISLISIQRKYKIYTLSRGTGCKIYNRIKRKVYLLAIEEENIKDIMD